MWDIVCISPQGHRSVSVSRHFLLQAPLCPCSVRKRFSRDHCCRGRSQVALSYFSFRFISAYNSIPFVFGVTSSLAVIQTIHCPLWLCIVWERVWSVSRCRTTAMLTGYHAWHLVVEYLHTHNKRKAGHMCDLQTTLQQLLIANPDIHWELRF